MNFSLHPEAEKELISAFAFYRERAGESLAKSFLAEFERVAKLLAANPLFGTPLTDDYRSYPFRRFPYSLIYRPTTEEIRILVVGHQHRRPGYWRDRE